MADHVAHFSATLRPLIAQMEAEPPAHIPRRTKLGVLIDCGHSDVGSTTENTVQQEVATLKEGIELLAASREAVLKQFLAEVDKIGAGIKEGSYIDDGDGQFFIAQIVRAESEPQFGENELVKPVAGVAVWWYPNNPDRLEPYEWADEDYWDDFFGTAEEGEESPPC